MSLLSRRRVATAIILLLNLQLIHLGEARNEDGEWGVPENTFTIPVSNPADGLYLVDIQASYSHLDWPTLDRLYIPAGQYKFIKMGNLPNRSPERPLIITNQGGQVRVGGLDMYFLASFYGGSNWILTGKYDPISLTGHVGYPGHRGYTYANTQGTYGILVDDDYRTFGTGNSGLGVGDPSMATSDFELSFIEIREIGFAGFAIKSDNLGSATMRNVKIHDNYIHDTGSEGIYLGSTQNHIEQHSFENLDISNNRILRTGTEGLQAGQLGDGCEIHHNVVALSAIDWKDSFQAYQDNSGQIAHRYGNASVHHNIFIGAGDCIINFHANNAVGDVHSEGDSLKIHDNFFSSGRFLGMHMAQGDQPRTSDPVGDGVTMYEVSNNAWRQFVFQKDEVYGNWPPPNEVLIQVDMKFTSDVLLDGNALDTPGLDHLKLSKYPYQNWLETNGVSGSITGTNNVRENVDPVTFANFLPGIPADVDYLLIERWVNISHLFWGPVHYTEGDYVTHRGSIYQAIVGNTGVQPDLDTTASAWALLPAPVDDVRLACDSAHQGVGLLDTLTCGSAACQWCIHFDTASAQLGPVSGADDITITYKDTPAPTTNGDVKKYSSTLFFTDGESCTSATNNENQNAADQGITIGTGSYDVEAGKWKVPLDIDINTIESLGFASIPDPTNEPNKFQIRFCLRTDLLTELLGVEGDIAVASEGTILTFIVDKEQAFDISNFAVAPDATTSDEFDVLVDVTITAEFCTVDEVTGAWIGSPPVQNTKPGQAIAFCVYTTSGDAQVEKLKSVNFKNGLDTELSIPIIDAAGNDVGLSNGDCTTEGPNASKCRVSSVAYARLFERVKTDGSLELIYSAAKIDGTAVLKLSNGHRKLAKISSAHNHGSARQLQGEQQETPVNKFDLDVGETLSVPPDRSSASATTMSALVSMMRIGCLLIGLLLMA